MRPQPSECLEAHYNGLIRETGATAARVYYRIGSVLWSSTAVSVGLVPALMLGEMSVDTRIHVTNCSLIRVGEKDLRYWRFGEKIAVTLPEVVALRFRTVLVVIVVLRNLTISFFLVGVRLGCLHAAQLLHGGQFLLRHSLSEVVSKGLDSHCVLSLLLLGLLHLLVSYHVGLQILLPSLGSFIHLDAVVMVTLLFVLALLFILVDGAKVDHS